MDQQNQQQKIVYIDMDGVTVDFDSGVAKLSPEDKEKFKEHYDNIHGIFATMEPVPDAITSVRKFFRDPRFDVYFLSKPCHKNSSSYSDKRDWIVKYFGDFYASRLILSQHKHLNMGDYLIDDRPVPKFTGKQLLFGSEEFPDWSSVLKFFDIS